MMAQFAIAAALRFSSATPMSLYAVSASSAQPVFQPIEIKITIESKEEYVAIKEMTSCYTGCPRAMVEGGQLDVDYQDKVELFFYQLNECL
jgi:hypothetical protein